MTAHHRHGSSVDHVLHEATRGGPQAIRVRGHCMAPALADGELVYITAAARYWPGDVIAFRDAHGDLRVHRLLGWRPWAGQLMLVTRGDRCDAVDTPVPAHRVFGRVEDASPATGTHRLLAVLVFCGLALRAALRRGHRAASAWKEVTP